MFSISSSFGQTLNISDLRKLFNYHKPTEHKQLFSKGFKVLSDTISINQKKIKFIKPDTKEIVELRFTEDGEGSEYLSITYFLLSDLAYKKIISTLAIYKFKYSKRNKRYQLPTSSYSGENVYPKGLTENNGKNYYSLEYVSYTDKALVGPRPEMRNDIELPPMKENIIDPKKDSR